MKKFTAVIMIMIILTAALAGCNGASGDKGKNLSASDIYNAVSSGLDFNKTVDLKDSRLADKYYIDTNLLEDHMVKISSVNISAQEIAVFKLKDAKDAQKIVDGINKRKADVDKDFANYLPAQAELVRASSTVTRGRYILFVIANDSAAAAKKFEDLFK